MEGRVDREYTIYEADLDAEYDQVYDIDLSTLNRQSPSHICQETAEP